MTSFQIFTWRGVPIPDINQWAADRGERMVRYTARRQTPYGPEVEDGTMPESFWQGLLMKDGWHYTESK